MKLLLVCPNRERAPYPVAPLGALAVAAAAQRAGHRVDVLDLMFVRSPRRALKHALRRGSYEAIGFSIRNLDNCVLQYPRSYHPPVEHLARAVHGSPRGGLPLILGGSGFSVSPQGWMRRLNATCGVVGEGEQALVALLDRMEAGQSVAGLRGVVCAEDKGDRSLFWKGLLSPSAPATCSANLDSLPPPAHGRCDYRPYLARGGFVSVQSKRGCPYGCIYCTYPALEGTAYRLRTPERVVDELEILARMREGCYFFFTDSVFNTPREHALAVCRRMARRKVPARWMAYCNPVQFDEELARAMVEAGCVGVEFTLDAATEKMLRAMGKPFAPSDIRTALAATSKAGLPCAVYLLFGGPGETLDDMRECQGFLDSCATPNAVFAALGIRIYAGTPIQEIARREGVIAPDADLFEPAYYLSPALGSEPMKVLDEMARARPEWSTPTDWAKLTLRVVQRVVNRLGVRPQWRDVRNYGKHMR